MPEYLENNRPYRLADYSRDETPARLVDVGLWPKRGFIPSPVHYQEWFDWSALFIEGAAERLFSISRAFSSSSIRLACLLTDSPAEQTQFIRVVELDREHLAESYFKAIWDEQSTSLPAPLGVAARMVMVWDNTEEWIIVNDRFYEMGLFAILGRNSHLSKTNFFHCLDEQELLNRFSSILRSNKVSGLAEVRRWQGGTDV
ncbi:hypothetical protein JQ629_18800 [Bradyrhizobium sp. AUGA SZCCT0222]|uniref:hypothetical protein n=1 Tax=Bradyrhizobium sp. AUGA SZCCT0222 TaxID=2807668 RepID=UPI001BA650BF|nr:hypothetical protein [Bradyrhizobium sp. AUGA SZCCT0222]MBR1269564.1 hypothetical protein [Bradyrhizobium sp. AUGA SZCCT0222]